MSVEWNLTGPDFDSLSGSGISQLGPNLDDVLEEERGPTHPGLLYIQLANLQVD
jgi:hypothetical protein